MNINVEHQPNCRAVLHIELPADVIKQERTAIVTNFAAQARLPGYRPGKVPTSVVEKIYKDAVDGELQNRLVNVGCYRAIEKENLEVIQVLSVRDTKLQDDGTFTFTAEVSTAPKFELPEYKGIPVKLERVEVTEHDVNHELFHLREHHQKFDDVERVAELGDAVVLNYTASMDGTALEESHPDLPVHFRKIEGNWFLLDKEEDFLPGFYAALVGIKKDDKREITITLPEDFHNDVLKGKTIVLDATCTAVKQKHLPELDDAFAKQLLGDEATVETLRKEVENNLRQRREQGREQSLANQLLAHLHDKLDFEVPVEIVEREAQNRANDMAMRAARQGMPEEDILKHQDEILNTASQQARQNVRLSFILEQIAQKEELTVSDAQLSMALSNLAARSKQSPKKFMAEAQRSGMIDRLRDNLRIENAVDFLKENAVIEDIDPVAQAHGCDFEKAEAKA